MSDKTSEQGITVETPLIAAFDATALLDPRLSMKAKGIAAILLSLGTWAGTEDVNTEDLTALATDGRDAVLAGLKELETAGYLTRTRHTGDAGRIYWKRTMRARPTITGFSVDGSTVDGKPGHGENEGQTEVSTINGKPGHGATPATSGGDPRTITGKPGHGGSPDLTRAHAHTRILDLNNSNSNSELSFIDQELSRDQDLQNSNPDLNSNSNSNSTQEGVTRVTTHARTHAGAPEVVSLGSVPSEPGDPEVAALAASMLRQCGVGVAANRMYPRYSIEHIRAECLRFMVQYPSEHDRKGHAGALVHRIKNNPYKPLTQAEQSNWVYRGWRTPAEVEADRVEGLVIEPANSLAVPPVAATSDERGSVGSVPSDTPKPVQIPDPAADAWAQVVKEFTIEQGGTFDRWINDTWVESHDDTANLFVIGLPDAFRYDWIVTRLSRQINRKLSVITGRPATTEYHVRVAPGAVGAVTSAH